MFTQEKFMGKRVLKSSLIDDENVVAFFSTRDLPLKHGEREDLIEEVEANKKLVAEGLGIMVENLVIPIQTHSDNIRCIEAKTHRCIESTDALITAQPNVALALNFADCVPIIFYDPTKKVIAIAHAGWRGTAAKIAVKTIKKMQNEFGCEPKNIIALIGPSIGKCCFEVGEDVLQKLLDTVNETECELVYDKIKGAGVDLKLINKFQILANGVEKIDLCEDCTCCKTELFFSYRKEKGNTARHCAVAMLKSEM